MFWILFKNKSLVFHFPINTKKNYNLNDLSFSHLYTLPSLQFSSVHSHSHVRLFVTPCTTTSQASLSITNTGSLPKLMSIESVMPSNHLLLCCPLSCLQSFPASASFQMSQFFASGGQSIGVLDSTSVLPRFNISLSSENPGLISFRMDWLDLLKVRGTLKSLLQHHSSKASILQHSVFFLVQFSYSYMTIGKTIALTRQTLVGKVMSLLLNMLSRRRHYCSSFKMRKLVHRDLCPHVLGHRANSRWAKWLSFVKS